MPYVYNGYLKGNKFNEDEQAYLEKDHITNIRGDEERYDTPTVLYALYEENTSEYHTIWVYSAEEGGSIDSRRYMDAHRYATNGNGDVYVDQDLNQEAYVIGFKIPEPPDYHETNIPIFKNEDDAQEYVTTGDDSKAVNYDELHRPIYHFYANNNGDVINLKWDIETDNTCEVNVTFKSPQFPFKEYTLAIDTTTNFNWDGIMSNLGGVVGNVLTKLTMEIHGKTYNQAVHDDLFYLSAEFGRDRVMGLIGDVTATVTIGESNESTLDVSTDGKFKDNSTDSDVDNTTPDATLPEYGNNGLGTTYKLTLDDIKAFGNEIWDMGIFDNLSLLNNSPIENIVSILRMPCNCEAKGSLPLKLGNYVSNVSAGVVTNNVVRRRVVNDEVIPKPPKLEKGFLNYSPYTQLSLFLPLVGLVPIDASVVLGNSISIDYILDCVVGTCTICVYVNNGNGTTLIYQTSCSASVEVPISASNKAQLQASLISGTVGTIGSALTGNAVGTIRGAIGTLESYHNETMTSGHPTSQTALLGQTQCYYVLKYPITHEPDNFAHTVGYMCMEQHKLSDTTLKGFVVCENVDLSGVDCLAEEKEMLKTILESGFYNGSV